MTLMRLLNRPLDTLALFATSQVSSAAPVRYAIRQVLDQEYQKSLLVRDAVARQSRSGLSSSTSMSSHPATAATAIDLSANPVPEIKKDFFGRIIKPDEATSRALREIDGNENAAADGRGGKSDKKEDLKVWVSYHEGFSNAVRKPLTVAELLRGL